MRWPYFFGHAVAATKKAPARAGAFKVAVGTLSDGRRERAPRGVHD